MLEIYSKREVATSIQNEVKALLYDYLSGSNQDNTGGTSVLSISELLRDTKKTKLRLSKVFCINSAIVYH
jgi:hypothetical protein